MKNRGKIGTLTIIQPRSKITIEVTMSKKEYDSHMWYFRTDKKKYEERLWKSYDSCWMFAEKQKSCLNCGIGFLTKFLGEGYDMACEAFINLILGERWGHFDFEMYRDDIQIRPGKATEQVKKVRNAIKDMFEKPGGLVLHRK